MKKSTPVSVKHDIPVFDLTVFNKTAAWSAFYIEKLSDHVKEHEFVGRPHKHDFYLVLFVEKGTGTHVIDFKQYRIQPATIFLMTPGQVHSWDLSKDIEGFIVFFTREFYQMHLSQNNLLEFPFYHSLGANPLIRPGRVDVLKFTIRQMYEEYKLAHPSTARMLRAYLDLFLLEAAKYYDPTLAASTHSTTFKLRKLEQLIDDNFRTLKHPADYAELMNLAPGYLNNICKESLGKTLTSLIQDRILLEAKRLFAYADMNVNEVASTLNFADASYFVRWFRKQTGATPEEFRKSLTR